MFSAQIKQ